jgi:hypothetical protein
LHAQFIVNVVNALYIVCTCQKNWMKQHQNACRVTCVIFSINHGNWMITVVYYDKLEKYTRRQTSISNDVVSDVVID